MSSVRESINSVIYTKRNTVLQGEWKNHGSSPHNMGEYCKTQCQAKKRVAKEYIQCDSIYIKLQTNNVLFRITYT